MKANTNLLALVITLAAPLAMRSQAPVIREPPPTEAPAVVVQTNAPQAAPVDISPGAAEVIRLAESGVGDEVVLAFIRNSQATFSLTADHVVYLKDLGLSEAVLSAMITHDTDIRGQTPLTAAVTNQPPPPVPVVTNQLTAPLVPPAPTYVEQPAYVTEPPPAEVSYYYNDLAPYGSWVVLDGYGWCWQPRTVVINRAWRPYCDGGHWVYTDCGWYWQSDYSWGWAPFHYGRWYLHNRCGWVWTPDRVWGPAWVSWRTSGDYCGWAPLPPRAYYDSHHGWRYNGVSVGISFGFGLHSDHFTFVSMHSFTDRDLRHHRVPHNEVRNVYNRTTINNNYTIVNNTVVNNGVPVDRVASATRREIRRATVREATPDNERRSTWQTSGRNNDTVVYRREPRAPSAPIRAEAQKVDSKNPVIQHPAVTAPTLATRSPRRGEGTDSNVTERRSGTTWQTPQRSTSTANRPQSSSTSPRVSREPQSTSTAPRVTREASSPSTTVQQTPSTAPRSTWQTPSRSDRSAAPQARSQPAAPQPVTVPSAPRAAVQERPSTAVQPNRSTTWETPSSRSRAQTAPNNVVQTAPAQGNPHVFYPKSAPQSQGVRGGQSVPAPSPQGSVRQAPPSSSNSRWQTGTRVESSARGNSANSSNRGNSGNSNNSGNSSKSRD